VDLAYSSRVSLQIAANARDELRASYLARSGVAMSRLVLGFQQQLDARLPQGAVSGGMPRFQIWSLVPVGSELVQGLFPAAGVRPAPASPHGGGDGGGPSFTARIEDESRKVNVQMEGAAITDQRLWVQVQSLYQLICEARFDPLFDREDARGVRSTREDLLVRLRDWGDKGEQTSELKVKGGSGASCGMVPDQPPFLDAFGDENQPYDRGEDRYRAKNARFDSLDELYLVAGVSDAFMAAFGESLTVYMPVDAKRSLNAVDKVGLVLNARTLAEPMTAQAVLFTPEFADLLQKEMVRRTFGGFATLSTNDIAEIVKALGVRVNEQLLAAKNSPFTDQSTSFRIRATGTAGAVRSNIDAVVWLEQAQQGTPVAAPGRLVHWREE
jgi:general secretion pathway protein K